MDTETGGQDSAITSNNEESNTAKDVSMVDVSKANGEGFAPTNNEAGEEAQVQAQAQAQAQAQQQYYPPPPPPPQQQQRGGLLPSQQPLPQELAVMQQLEQLSLSSAALGYNSNPSTPTVQQRNLYM